ncbi:MAG: CDP-alcohol phosphatidyltransferase family protein [Candidatus Nealsonbacteria bacterium]
MESIKELRKICRRSDVTKPGILVRIIRFFSIYFTWFFLHFKKFTANQLTVFSTVIFTAGVFCYIKGDYTWNIVGLLLVWIGIITDYSDGEMARYQRASLEKTNPNQFNKLQVQGTSLEGLTHDIKYAVLFVSLALGNYSSFPYPMLLLCLGFAASMAEVLGRLTKLRYIHSILPIQTEKVYLAMSENKFYAKQNRLRKTIDKTFGGTTGIATWLTLATLLDKVYLIVIFYGVLSSMVYLVLLYKQYKGFQKL